jgi:hypothetical protein
MFTPPIPSPEALDVHSALLDLGWDNCTEEPIETEVRLYFADIWIWLSDGRGVDVEIDGWHHGVEPWFSEDLLRDSLIRDEDILVRRFWNRAVHDNLWGVAQEISDFCSGEGGF